MLQTMVSVRFSECVVLLYPGLITIVLTLSRCVFLSEGQGIINRRSTSYLLLAWAHIHICSLGLFMFCL